MLFAWNLVKEKSVVISVCLMNDLQFRKIIVSLYPNAVGYIVLEETSVPHHLCFNIIN